MAIPPQPVAPQHKSLRTAIIALSIMLASLVALIAWLVYGRGVQSTSPPPPPPAPATTATQQSPAQSSPAQSSTEPGEAQSPTPSPSQSSGVSPAPLPPPAPPSTRATVPQPTQPNNVPSKTALPEPAPQPSQKPADPKPAQPTKTVSLNGTGTATFRNFTVTAPPVAGAQLTTDDLVAVPVKVCVTKSLDDAGPGLTRVSTRPWSLSDSTGKVYRPKPGAFKPDFPRDAKLRQGECVAGNLTFELIKHPVDYTTLRYQNGLGDVAEWQSH